MKSPGHVNVPGAFVLPMRFLILICLSLISGYCLAQLPTRFITGGISTQAYKGDVKDSYAKWTPGLHAGVQFNRNKRLNGAIMAQAGYVIAQNPALKSSAPANASPVRYVRTSLISGHYELQYSFIRKESWKVFLSQGIGLLRYVPRDRDGQNLNDIANTRAANETFSGISLLLPTSVGVHYVLPNRWFLGLQGCYLHSTTDYLDNLGEWGQKKGSDNVLQYRFVVGVPL